MTFSPFFTQGTYLHISFVRWSFIVKNEQIKKFICHSSQRLPCIFQHSLHLEYLSVVTSYFCQTWLVCPSGIKIIHASLKLLPYCTLWCVLSFLHLSEMEAAACSLYSFFFLILNLHFKIVSGFFCGDSFNSLHMNNCPGLSTLDLCSKYTTYLEEHLFSVFGYVG